MVSNIIFFREGKIKKIAGYRCVFFKDIDDVEKAIGDTKYKYSLFVDCLDNLILEDIKDLKNIKIKESDLIISKSKLNEFSNKNIVYSIDSKDKFWFFDNLYGTLVNNDLLKKYKIQENNLFKIYAKLTQDVKSIEWIDCKLSSYNQEFDINIMNEYKNVKEQCRYNFIYKSLEKILFKFNEWDKTTNIILIKKFNNIIFNIDKENFFKYLEYRADKDIIQIIKTLMILIKENDLEGIMNISSLYNEKHNLKNDIKKNEIELDKMKKLLTKDRFKITILFDKLITMSRRFIAFLEYYLSKPFLSHKNIWLIGERTDQAEDNGYVFFKYCREQIKDLKIFYLIDKKSVQVHKVEELGNVIYINSRKHKYYLMHAKNLISAYDFMNFLLPSDSERFKKYYLKYVKGNRIFLQHGVALNKANYYNKYINKHDYILVSTIKEYNMFTKEYGYNDNELLKIGLARYDNLIDKSHKNKKKTILFMPTWRSSICDLSNDDFKKTTYYKSINSLIKNKKLLEFLEKNNIVFKVYLHYQMQHYLDLFKFNNKNIEFLDRNAAIVQELLNSSDLLITDFSSVGVDFSYLNKPVIFYQFSEENFHYDINYEKDYTLYSDFGKVTHSENVVLKQIEIWKENNYKNFYNINSNLFFKQNSNDNCVRIYEFISKLGKKSLKEKSIKIKNLEGNIIEERLYDYNYNFIKRIFYNNNLKTRELIYNNGFLDKQLLYSSDQQVIKMDEFYKNIKINTEFYDIYDKKENKFYKHQIAYNGNLKNKEIIDMKSNRIIKRNIYDINENKIKSIEKFYENGVKESYIEYNSKAKPIKYIYYNKQGIRTREYNYYNSGKVKEKMFFDNEGKRVIKRVTLSEIESKIIKEIRYNKKTKKYKEVLVNN